jgi:hypothetical protein
LEVANMELALRGALVGVLSREYKAFKDETGAEQAGGTTHRMFVSTGFEQEPTEVRCKGDELLAAKGLGQGAVLDLVVTPRARDKSVSLVLVSMRPGESNGKTPAGR